MMFPRRFKFSIPMNRLGFMRLLYAFLSATIFIFTFFFIVHPSIVNVISSLPQVTILSFGKAVSWFIIIWLCVLLIAIGFYLYGISRRRPAYAIFEIQILGEKKMKGLDFILFILAAVFLISKLIYLKADWYSLTVFSMIFAAFVSNLFSKKDLVYKEGEILPEPSPLPPPPPRPEEPESEEIIFRDYAWSSSVGAFEINEFPISKKEYESFQDKNRKESNRKGGYPYDYYARRVKIGITNETHLLIDKIYKTHESASGIDRIDNLLQFVHEPNFKYSSDKDTTHSEDYARYPIETLVEKTGDCDCLSILAATLFKLHGYNSALIFTKSHCMAGVEVPAGVALPGTWIEQDSIKYFICEATGQGWRVGQIGKDVAVENVSPV